MGAGVMVCQCSLWLSTHLQRAQPDISGLTHLLCCEEAPCGTGYDPIMTFVGCI